MRATLCIAALPLLAAMVSAGSTPGFLLSGMASMKDKLSDKDILVKPAEMTLGTCGLKCTVNDECKGVAYNHDKKLCQLHSKTPSSGKKATKWRTYEKKAGKKFGS